jgi:hypothetical protein
VTRLLGQWSEATIAATQDPSLIAAPPKCVTFFDQSEI